MNDLRRKFDHWLGRVNDDLFNNGKPVHLIRHLAIIMLITGVLSILSALSLFNAGSELAGLGDFGLGMGTILMFWSSLRLAGGLLVTIAGYGLFQRKRWGRQMAIWSLGIGAIIYILGICFSSGESLLYPIFAALYAYAAYLVYHHGAMKQESDAQ